MYYKQYHEIQLVHLVNVLCAFSVQLSLDDIFQQILFPYIFFKYNENKD